MNKSILPSRWIQSKKGFVLWPEQPPPSVLFRQVFTKDHAWLVTVRACVKWLCQTTFAGQPPSFVSEPEIISFDSFPTHFLFTYHMPICFMNLSLSTLFKVQHTCCCHHRCNVQIQQQQEVRFRKSPVQFEMLIFWHYQSIESIFCCYHSYQNIKARTRIQLSKNIIACNNEDVILKS